MSWFVKRFFVFFLCFYFEIYFAEASPRVLFYAQQPEKCAEYETYPCAISSGSHPHYFFWGKNHWEMAKNTVVAGREGGKWRAALGHFVVKAKEPVVLETPFAEIHIEHSDVFLELKETRVTIQVVGGKTIRIKPRGEDEEHLLAPGFKNWYAGIGPEGQDIGVPMVMDLNGYAKKRAHFFTDHKLGFVNELRNLAQTIKSATLLAAQMHKDLVNEKRALLQAAYDASMDRDRRRREYNRYLQRLFRKKVNYDY